jgi:hypothetical protein
MFEAHCGIDVLGNKNPEFTVSLLFCAVAAMNDSTLTIIKRIFFMSLSSYMAWII